MTILVTGAGGFIGLNLVRHLKASHPEAAIVAVDLHNDLDSDLDRLDVRDRVACFDLFQRVQPTHFLHAAAVTMTDNAEAVRLVNFQGTVNVMDAAMASGSLRRGLVLSSSAVYGLPDGEPCDEEHARNPVGAYARAKRDVELLLEAQSLPIAAARLGPVYGPFERPRASRPRTSLIHQLGEALLERRTVRVAGDDMHRDWTHATDIAAALDGLLFAPKLNHRVYNVSSGHSVSAREIIALFEERGLKVCWMCDANRADIFLDERDSRQPLVIDRLRQDTGFRPRFDVRSGIRALND